MPRYRFDLHVHTRFSPDGLDSPRRVVEAARAAGLDGIAVTDHNRCGAYERLCELGLADPSGEPVDGFLVVPGVEVSSNEGHVLVLGAGWDARPGMSAEAVVRRAHAMGGIAAAAHPFERSRSGVGKKTLDRVAFDAVEVFNSKSVERRSNARAEEYARLMGMGRIGGSDAHEAVTVGRAHTLVEAEQLRVWGEGGIVEAVRSGATEVVEGTHTAVEIARYWVRGWLTRPWLIDWVGRSARRVLGVGLEEEWVGEGVGGEALGEALGTGH